LCCSNVGGKCGTRDWFNVYFLSDSKHLAMAQMVSRWPVTMETRVPSQVSPGKICGEWSSIPAGFSPSACIVRCQYHSTIAPYSFIHSPPTLYNVTLPVLLFSPCQYHSTIAPFSSVADAIQY